MENNIIENDGKKYEEVEYNYWNRLPIEKRSSKQIFLKLLEEPNQKEGWLDISKYKEGYEIFTEVQHKNLTFSDIKEILIAEYEIADYPLLQKLRNDELHKCFKDFWVFVPNPDKISEAKGCVAWFGAVSEGADLSCSRGPTYADSSLGVFVVRKKLKVIK